MWIILIEFRMECFDNIIFFIVDKNNIYLVICRNIFLLLLKIIVLCWVNILILVNLWFLIINKGMLVYEN